MQNKNKPLLLRPSGKDYLWGGSRLNDEFEKNIDLTPLAETWECSTHPDGPSYVVGGAFDGQELAEVLRAHPEYLGERHKGENALPILIKFIDAKKDLSVQVHPTDAYAQERENGQLGKTEMWYVLDASKDAKLVYGLKRERTEQQMRDAIAKGTLMKDLQWVPVKKDDLFFIEAGISNRTRFVASSFHRRRIPSSMIISKNCCRMGDCLAANCSAVTFCCSMVIRCISWRNKLKSAEQSKP